VIYCNSEGKVENFLLRQGLPSADILYFGRFKVCRKNKQFLSSINKGYKTKFLLRVKVPVKREINFMGVPGSGFASLNPLLSFLRIKILFTHDYL